MRFTLNAPVTVDNDAWHYAVISTDGVNQYLYLDGALAASSSLTIPVGNDNLQYVYVGAGTSGNNWPQLANLSQFYFKGSISDVAVYDHGLSTGTVAEQYGELGASSGVTPVITEQVTAPQGFEATAYDPMQGGRVLAATDADGGTTRYGYDADGFLNTVTDPLGDVTTTGHDVRGNVISTTTCQDQAAAQCSTSYNTYWPDDSSATLTPDPRDDLRTSARDGRAASASDPKYLTTYSYDPYGDLLSTTDPLGRSATSTYTTGTQAAIAAPASTSSAAACSAAAQTSGTAPVGLLASKKVSRIP